VKFAVNLSMLFTEVPFLARFEQARRAGFDAVEFWYPYREDAGLIAAELDAYRLTLVLFNLDIGTKGGRGYAADPAQRERFRATTAQGIEIARQLGCARLNVLVGNVIPGVPREEQDRTLIENLRTAAVEVARAGIILHIEALNRYDAPEYFLRSSAQALAIIRAVSHPALKFQYDVYHMQRGEGNLTGTLVSNLEMIGHIQIADAPDRGQPGTGEINFRYLLGRIARAGYRGYISAEYQPAGPSAESFGWLQEVLP